MLRNGYWSTQAAPPKCHRPACLKVMISGRLKIKCLGRAQALVYRYHGLLVISLGVKGQRRERGEKEKKREDNKGERGDRGRREEKTRERKRNRERARVREEEIKEGEIKESERALCHLFSIRVLIPFVGVHFHNFT